MREPTLDGSTPKKGFSAEAKEWMSTRSAAFQAVTQKRKMPMVYGAQTKDKKR